MSIVCIYKKQSGCFSWDCIQATHIQKHISVWMFQLGLHIGNLSVHEHNMHKTLWMPYFLMGIKETNTRTRQSPYAWLMEIIWLQTLNHKSCSTNVVLQNGRNHNHFMEKVQAFGTIRSCPFKALRLPKEDWSWNNSICFGWSHMGPILGVWFHETPSQPGCTVL